MALAQQGFQGVMREWRRLIKHLEGEVDSKKL